MHALCGKCNVAYGGVNDIGETVPCHCLPEGKSCADCKFAKECLKEKVTHATGTICSMHYERGFAEPGQLSYMERWADYWRKRRQNRKQEEKHIAEEMRKKKEARQRELAGRVWTKQKIIESMIPRRYRKGNIPTPNTNFIEVSIDNPDIPEELRIIKEKWDEAARKDERPFSMNRGSHYLVKYQGKTYKIPAPPLPNGQPLSDTWHHLVARVELEKLPQASFRWVEGEFIPYEWQKEGRYDSIWEWQFMCGAETVEEAAELYLDKFRPSWKGQIGKLMPQHMWEVGEHGYS